MINKNFGAFDNTNQNKFGSFLFGGKIAEGIKKLSNETVGVNGKTESVKDIANAVYERPTSYTEAPELIKGRLDDIASLYSLVQPIEGKSLAKTEQAPEAEKTSETKENNNEEVKNSVGNNLKGNVSSEKATYTSKNNKTVKTGDKLGSLALCMSGVML